MKVHCAHDALVKIDDLKLFPKNPNKHSEEQIQRLAKILEYQGWRYPVKVSKLSGFVTSGHGRILAAKANGWHSVPVNYQPYDNTEQEYADVVADNSIASWAELEYGLVNSELENLGPDFDLEMLGLKGFMLEPADKLDPDKEWEGLPEFEAPEQQSKMIIIIEDESRKLEFLKLLGISDYKKHKEQLWSMRWPQK